MCSHRDVPARDPPWTPAVTLPHGCDGLSARRMVVLWTSRELSLGHHVRRAFLRNVWCDFAPLYSRNCCHQRSYFKEYSRFMRRRAMVGPLLDVYPAVTCRNSGGGAVHSLSQRVSIPRYCGGGVVGGGDGASSGTPGTWFPLAYMHCW